MSRRIAILASGVGTTFEYLLECQKNGDLKHKIVLLVTNNKNAGAISTAKKNSIDYALVNFANDNPTSDQELLDVLGEKKIDLIFLAGFLKKIGPRVLHAYDGRIFNSHPSLLPKYGGAGMYGRKVTEAVLLAREAETGVTIHKVSADYDRGQILVQERVPILDGDSVEALESRVKSIEKKMILKFLNAFG